MFLLGKYFRASSNTIRRLTFLLVVVFFSQTILQGSTHCFCSSEDDAGSEAHSEHHPQSHAGGHQSLVAEDNCAHLTFGNMQPSDRARAGGEKIVAAVAADVYPMAQPDLNLSRALHVVQNVAFRSRGSPHYQLIFIAHSIQIVC